MSKIVANDISKLVESALEHIKENDKERYSFQLKYQLSTIGLSLIKAEHAIKGKPIKCELTL